MVILSSIATIYYYFFKVLMCLYPLLFLYMIYFLFNKKPFKRLSNAEIVLFFFFFSIYPFFSFSYLPIFFFYVVKHTITLLIFKEVRYPFANYPIFDTSYTLYLALSWVEKRAFLRIYSFIFILKKKNKKDYLEMFNFFLFVFITNVPVWYANECIKISSFFVNIFKKDLYTKKNPRIWLTIFLSEYLFSINSYFSQNPANMNTKMRGCRLWIDNGLHINGLKNISNALEICSKYGNIDRLNDIKITKVHGKKHLVLVSQTSVNDCGIISENLKKNLIEPNSVSKAVIFTSRPTLWIPGCVVGNIKITDKQFITSSLILNNNLITPSKNYMKFFNQTMNLRTENSFIESSLRANIAFALNNSLSLPLQLKPHSKSILIDRYNCEYENYLIHFLGFSPSDAFLLAKLCNEARRELYTLPPLMIFFCSKKI